MKLYNTLTRTVQEFQPLDGKTVRMYVCGPTVYDVPHIGHARSAYIFDVLRRYLEHNGFSVQFVRNVTDVDDKIIEKAKQESVVSGQWSVVSDLRTKCAEVAEKYLQRYHETMDRLGIGRPTQEPLATGHIDEMLNLISQLVLNGSAYETKTGDVYFAVRKFPGYGKLSNRSIDELQAGTRVEPGEQKQNPLDFALWKAAKPDEPAWSSPWGKGRPGWHIECSAMSTKYLGDEFDIHGGGVDLVFPHHENEVAQAQAAGKPFARSWIHNGLLTVNGEKMSKSLGNFITVDTALKECQGEPDALKMFFLGTHYRSPIDYSMENLKASLERLNSQIHFLRTAHFLEVETEMPSKSPQEILRFEHEFSEAMDNDLNTPEALAVLDKLVSFGYQLIKDLAVAFEGGGGGKRKGATANIILVSRVLRRLGEALGLFGNVRPLLLPEEDKQLIDEREAARKQKDFHLSDQIRKKLSAKGYVIEDTPDGPVVYPKS